jgi:hypothetical protein
MATLDHYSSRDKVLNSLMDNASYDEDESLAKAKLFRTACRIWLMRWAVVKSKNSESELWLSVENVQKQLDQAEAWIRAQPTASPADAYAGYSKVTLANGRD